MAVNAVRIVGVCRFSMLGRGDWKVYKNQPDEMLEQIYAEKALELFAPERLEARLQTFEHLTLRSMAAQTDDDFTFLVVSSDRMPEAYRARLAALCAQVPQVELRFVGPAHISVVQKEVMEELSLPIASCAQFRLDDDDCVSSDFVRRARRNAAALWSHGNFGMSFAQQYYCVTDGPTEGVYNWFSPFFSAGAFIRHKDKSVFDYGHYQIPSRMLTLSEPSFPNIVTHRGDNDTPRHEAAILRKRGMVRASPDEVARMCDRHFAYLTEEGLALCGFDRVLAGA